MIWPDPTHQPTQPPTHPPMLTPTHEWLILQRFSNLSNGIEISWSSWSVIEFYVKSGGPYSPGGLQMGGWGWSWLWVWSRVNHSSKHAAVHTHARMDACTCMLNMLYIDASMSAAICNFYTCIIVRVCMCMCACMRVCVEGHPPCPPTHLPPPQSHREPKTPKFNKSWTNQDNSILFEDSIPLNIPELIQTIADHPRHPPPTCLIP